MVSDYMNWLKKWIGVKEKLSINVLGVMRFFNMKDYFATQESFDELLELMRDYNVFTYGITATGEKGYDYSHEFREWLLKCSKKAESIKFKGTQVEFYISSLMTWNNISLELAQEMANVIGGRNIEAEKLRLQKQDSVM